MCRYLTASVLMLVLSACMSVPQQHFNQAANPQIKRIAVVPVNKPSEYVVEIVHHPGNSFGLIGGLVALTETSSKTNQFTTRVGRQA